MFDDVVQSFEVVVESFEVVVQSFIMNLNLHQDAVTFCLIAACL